MLWSLVFVLTAAAAFNAPAAEISMLEQLGKALFFDTGLSDPPGQSCASCHAPQAGWSGPDSKVNATLAVYAGVVHGRFGNRKPPSAAYATPGPVLQFDEEERIFTGGLFWDGRATGWLLGLPAADQAQDPFVNPLEQNNKRASNVVRKVCAGAYAELFRGVFGSAICNKPIAAYNAIAQAIAAFEASPEVNAFSSRYDYYLREPDKYPLSDQERLGLKLFEDADKGNCAACHPSQVGPNGEPPLFTDFTFDNLGVPRNPQNPWYAMGKAFNPAGVAWVDEGLGGFLRTVPRYAEHTRNTLGKQRVPTLRNVDKRPDPTFVKAYGHNGYFKSLKAITHFYNTRDVLPACEGLADARPNENCWPAAEVAANVNEDELGDLGLTDAEEDAIVAFMKTLSDGWQPPRPLSSAP
ncbi:MAG: cytochrome C [Pseudomonadota bacterium]|nr:MAG: cytochrome C [Pseudomonadota bacterium]